MPWITKKPGFRWQEVKRNNRRSTAVCSARPTAMQKAVRAGIVCDWQKAVRPCTRANRGRPSCARQRCTTLWTSAGTSLPGRASIGFAGIAKKTGKPCAEPAWPCQKAFLQRTKVSIAPKLIAFGASCTWAGSYFCQKISFLAPRPHHCALCCGQPGAT